MKIGHQGRPVFGSVQHQSDPHQTESGHDTRQRQYRKIAGFLFLGKIAGRRSVGLGHPDAEDPQIRQDGEVVTEQ